MTPSHDDLRALAEKIAAIVDKREPDAIQILGFPMPLAREILATLRALAAAHGTPQEPLCARCRMHPARLCMGCHECQAQP